MLLCKDLELWATRHRTVIVENFDDDASRLAARKSREVATRFRMTGTRQHTARLRHQWKNVSGLTEIFGARLTANGCLNRMRSIVSGNARSHALRGFDRQREVRCMACVRVGHHER